MHTEVEILILGAGPAGLQMGYYLEKEQQSYLILEQHQRPGSFFEKFPRHRMLISINKVHTGKTDPEINLRWDWNSLLSDDGELLFKNYSRAYFPHPEDLCRYMADYATHYRLKIKYQTKIVKVGRQDNGFTLTDSEGNTYACARLIVATGVSQSYLPDIAGIEHAMPYDQHTIDPQAYVGQRVLIIGKGNSAFETANHLTETAGLIHMISPNSVTLAWKSHFVGNLRAVNNNFLDTYQLKSQNAVIDGSIDRIEREGDQYVVHIRYSHARGQTRVNRYDSIIACTGFRFDASIFDESCRPELTIKGRFPAMTTEWESVNVPDLYFAGTLTQSCDYKKTTSGFIHGFRYNVRALHHLMAFKYHGRTWPHECVEATPEAVLQTVLRRLNSGSGLFQQTGFLCDVVVVDRGGGIARHYTDIRRDYVPGSFLGEADCYYTISLEYGHFDGDPLNIERDPDPEKGETAAYLHPIIRRYRRGEFLTQHHIQDDLENEWYLEEYVAPARRYFEAELADSRLGVSA